MLVWIEKITHTYRERKQNALATLSADQQNEIAQLTEIVNRNRMRLIAAFIFVWITGALAMRFGLHDASWLEATILSFVVLGGMSIGLISMWLQPSALGQRTSTSLKLVVIAVAFATSGAIVGGLAGKIVRDGFQELSETVFASVALPVFIAGVTVGLFYAALTIALMQFRRNLLIRKNEELKTLAQQERLAHQLTEAKLRLMQAQVEPHFLFNTLASVQHLAEAQSPAAARLTSQLIGFLRGGLSGLRDESSTLAQEFFMVESYLNIMKTRMDERLEFSLDLPPALASENMPPAMLISLVENAIKHGLEPQPSGGRIDIAAHKDVNGLLVIRVADTGLGALHASGKDEGVGLSNIRERLHAIYGDRAALVVADNVPTGFIATLSYPTEQLTPKEI